MADGALCIGKQSGAASDFSIVDVATSRHGEALQPEFDRVDLMVDDLRKISRQQFRADDLNRRSIPFREQAPIQPHVADRIRGNLLPQAPYDGVPADRAV